MSFSIKKTKDDAPKEIKSALPVEESSDDEEVEVDGKNEVVVVATVSTTPPPPPPPEPTTETETKVLDEDDPILEMIDLTEDPDEGKKEMKRGNIYKIKIKKILFKHINYIVEDNKVKDKLAAAARELLASVSRDKQLERRKKAAAFLKLRSVEETKNASDVEGERTPPPPPPPVKEKKKHHRRRESDVEEGEIKKHKSKKKKSHKR